VALFICKRSVREPLKTPRFTVEEIEPFVAVEYRDGVPDGGVAVAVIGVAIEKADGGWRLHKLSDEANVRLGRHGSTSPEMAESLRNRAAFKVKRRLVHALNRLRERHTRVYVYPMQP
jgi:hypothetical protein